ncbi:MAG: tetratricopeptide repeat protein, partial [Acidobacteriota bacterium]|nr:tetratricopeptide repeat protein [Acidobacteriota bacterium]
ETRLRTFLAAQPDHYEGQRMLAAVLLSQHRYGAAIAQANKVQAMDPRDAWNYGAQGDGYLELGDYPRAFAAFDTMGRLQPGPPAYARVAYALELQGDLEGALEYMQRAADGTSPNDSEAQAWHYVQVGELWLLKGRLGDAKREFERAAATFPKHPLAHAGLAKIKIVEGDLKGARLVFQAQLAQGPTADTAAIIGDLSAELGDQATAAQYYAMAEQLERSGWTAGSRQPDRLARFLAERGRNLPEAVALAEEAAATRRDVMTLDTLAWAYFKAGRLPEARQASDEALRLGTRDPRLLYHAAAIVAASGDRLATTALLERVVAPDAVPDVLVARGIKALWKQ